MKQRFLLLSLMISLSFQAHTVTAQSKNSPSDHTTNSAALADTILHNIARISQRHNHFTETRKLHALKHPLFSEGELKFSYPDHIEKLTLLPVKDSVIIDGDVMQFQHGQGAARNIPLHLSPALQIIADTIRGPLEGNKSLLERYYVLSANGDAGQWRMTLTPRTKDVAHIIQLVRLEGHNNVIERTYLRQANGDVTDTIITPQ